MTWTKTGDDFPDRLLDRSDAAYRLHHAATTYCNRLGLDGRLPKARLAVVAVPVATRRPGIVRELVAAGIWHDDGDAWALADFFEAQLSRDEVEAQRRWDALRKQLHFAKTDAEREALKPLIDTARRARFEARDRRRSRAAGTSSGTSDDLVSNTVPTRPVPTRPGPAHKGRGRAAGAPEPSASEARSGAVVNGHASDGVDALQRALASGDRASAERIRDVEADRIRQMPLPKRQQERAIAALDAALAESRP